MPRASFAIAGALMALCSAASPALAACTISTTSVAFGTYNPRAATAVTGVGSIALDCQSNDRPVISIGTGSSGSFALRRMTNGASNLNYNLFTGATMTVIWGDGTGGSATVTPPRRASTTTVYGRIPAGQNVTAGTYNDTLIVTVNF